LIESLRYQDIVASFSILRVEEKGFAPGRLPQDAHSSASFSASGPRNIVSASVPSSTGKTRVVPFEPMPSPSSTLVASSAGVGQFAGAGGSLLSRSTWKQGLKRIINGLPVDAIRPPYPTPHDFRRTVATGLSALGIPREDRLAVLGHPQDGVHATHYDKYDRLPEKRIALEKWEAHVADIVAPPKTPINVVKIGQRR
jgi:hypothetical protein